MDCLIFKRKAPRSQAVADLREYDVLFKVSPMAAAEPTSCPLDGKTPAWLLFRGEFTPHPSPLPEEREPILGHFKI
jgi:hypothetical protein